MTGLYYSVFIQIMRIHSIHGQHNNNTGPDRVYAHDLNEQVVHFLYSLRNARPLLGADLSKEASRHARPTYYRTVLYDLQ